MQKQYKYEIDSKIFLNLIEVCKKLKSQIVVCYSENRPQISICGFDESLGLLKNIEDYSGKLNGISLPVGFAMRSTHLNEIEKEIKENNIQNISIICVGSEEGSINPITNSFLPHFIFSKTIICGSVEIPLLELNKLICINLRIQQELSFFSNVLISKELTNDSEFMEMQLTKTDDGLSTLHIGDHLVLVAPNMLNLIKDDEVSIEIRQANIGKFAIFNINKPKKKCNIRTIYRIMDIRKQR
jgi:hypothetical protein